MKDYRYVDRERLRSYLDQFNSISEAESRERKSFIKFSLGFLTAGLEEKKLAINELTEDKQITTLIEYLKKSKQLAVGRAESDEDRPDFVLETFEGCDVEVPSKNSEHASPALRFWFSEGNEHHSALCLLENYEASDEHHLAFKGGMSTFSVLVSFTYHARDKINNSILEKIIPRKAHINPNANIDDTHPASHHYELYSVRDYIWRFVAEPENLLREWGCIIGQRKKVTALYRTREMGKEAAKDWNLVSTFGYPIAICTGEA